MVALCGLIVLAAAKGLARGELVPEGDDGILPLAAIPGGLELVRCYIL